ncbi:hypothetical protein FOZ63_018027, partial [Perkinsus olseni]
PAAGPQLQLHNYVSLAVSVPWAVSVTILLRTPFISSTGKAILARSTCIRSQTGSTRTPESSQSRGCSTLLEISLFAGVRWLSYPVACIWLAL